MKPPTMADVARVFEGPASDDAPLFVGLVESLRGHAGALADIGKMMPSAGTQRLLHAIHHLEAAITLLGGEVPPPAEPDPRRALENVRLLVASRRSRIDSEIADHLLRFCREGGVVGTPLRAVGGRHG